MLNELYHICRCRLSPLWFHTINDLVYFLFQKTVNLFKLAHPNTQPFPPIKLFVPLVLLSNGEEQSRLRMVVSVIRVSLENVTLLH